jgi:hypothetical protein
MTESEWQSCADPMAMLEFLRDQPRERKLRLLAAACWRLHSFELLERRDRAAVEAREMYADELVSKEDLHVAWQRAKGVARIAALFHGYDAALSTFSTTGDSVERSSLIRCIFGNRFHNVSLDRTCLTNTVTTLASAIYTERAFDRLPILADALEDGGCTDAEILNHCRAPGLHARGCWVVDLLLRRQ